MAEQTQAQSMQQVLQRIVLNMENVAVFRIVESDDEMQGGAICKELMFDFEVNNPDVKAIIKKHPAFQTGRMKFQKAVFVLKSAVTDRNGRTKIILALKGVEGLTENPKKEKQGW